MPDFSVCYNRIVLESRIDVLARAYGRARGDLDESDWRWIDPDPEQQAVTRRQDLAAMLEREQFEHAETRRQHRELVCKCLDPVARHWLGHHLFGPREIDGLVHLLAREDQRFRSKVSDVVRSHATYAMRYATRELEDLLAKFPAVTESTLGGQQESAWLPLFRHFVREAIVRAYHAECATGGLPIPDWDAVLEMIVARLENDLRSDKELVGSFTEGSGYSPDEEDAHQWTAEDLPDDSELWLLASQSVGSNYDRNDADHIRRLIQWVTDRAAAGQASPRETQARNEFSHQLRLRFACTAYTHIVRGITTRMVEQQELPEVSADLQAARNVCNEACEADPGALLEIQSRLDEAIAACAMPFAALAMRKIDAARESLKKLLRSSRPGSPLRTQLDALGGRLAAARSAWDILPIEIQGYLQHALAGCKIRESADPDCGAALSWLRTISDSTPFGKTFDERLARARDAVAEKIREAWNDAIDFRLEEFLASNDACIGSTVGSSSGEYLARSSIWTLPPEKWADALAEQTFAEEFGRMLSTDQAAILEDLNVNLAAKRIDYADLRKQLATSPDFLQAWNMIGDIREAYAALFVLVRMRRNAPIRTFKYFTAICRLAENKGKDAETTMDLEEWMSTTERLFACLERDYLGNACSPDANFVGLHDWIERRRDSPEDSAGQALLPYYSLWERLLAGARPTSRAVPYLNAVRPALRPWFKVQAVPSS